MSGNVWMFSDEIDDEDLEFMSHDYVTYNNEFGLLPSVISFYPFILYAEVLQALRRTPAKLYHTDYLRSCQSFSPE